MQRTKIIKEFHEVESSNTDADAMKNNFEKMQRKWRTFANARLCSALHYFSKDVIKEKIAMDNFKEAKDYHLIQSQQDVREEVLLKAELWHYKEDQEE